MQHLTGVPAKAQFPLFINEILESHDSMMWYIHKMHRKIKHSKYSTFYKTERCRKWAVLHDRWYKQLKNSFRHKNYFKNADLVLLPFS